MVKLSSPRRHERQQTTFFGGFLMGFVTSSFIWLVSVSKSEMRCGGSQKIASFLLASTSQHAPVLSAHSLTSTHDADGWKSINIFYGNSSHIADSSTIPSEYFAVNRWFSQYRQDEVVSHLLFGKRNGYFVDLASNDAVRISNTYALETFFDWDGLCLEPNPAYWSSLSYRKCVVAAAVVGENTMDEVTFKFPKEKAAKGGIVGEEFDNKVSPTDQAHVRYTVRLVEIFQHFNVPKVIDYLSLDVEGAEDFVMGTFPFSEYQFNVLTVERPSVFLADILGSHGYILLKTLKKGKETLWVHSSVETMLDKSALEIDAQNYKYREGVTLPRTAV
jgi:hypothetical protein